MRKICGNKGITLVEMLSCVATLLLVGMICTTGMNIAMKSYQESVFEAESQMFQDTMNMYIGDILRYATEITISDESGEGKVESFTNSAYQIYNGNFYISSDGYLYCTVKNSSIGELVIAKGNYVNNLQIAEFELYYDDVTGIFTGKYKIKTSLSDTLNKECNFMYRTIADK